MSRRLTLQPPVQSLLKRNRVVAFRRCLHQQQQSPVRTPPLEYTKPDGVEHARPQPRAPYAIRERQTYKVNDSAWKLNAVFTKLLGEDVTLEEDVKWQAVTHKTFDHGRQPFNEKLSFLGQRLIRMHATLHKVSQAGAAPSGTVQSLQSITPSSVAAYLDPRRLAKVISDCGLLGVIRWQPMQINDLAKSGQMKIAAESLFAIIGAVALQKGGDVAGKLIKTQILPRI